MDSQFGITQSLLDSINVEQGRDENKQHLEELGGIDRLAELIGVNVVTGLTDAQVLALRERFGDNSFPESPMDSFLTLLFGALTDTTLLRRPPASSKARRAIRST